MTPIPEGHVRVKTLIKKGDVYAWLGDLIEWASLRAEDAERQSFDAVSVELLREVRDDLIDTRRKAIR